LFVIAARSAGTTAETVVAHVVVRDGKVVGSSIAVSS
jgi:hypothetical protein